MTALSERAGDGAFRGGRAPTQGLFGRAEDEPGGGTIRAFGAGSPPPCRLAPERWGWSPPERRLFPPLAAAPRRSSDGAGKTGHTRADARSGADRLRQKPLSIDVVQANGPRRGPSAPPGVSGHGPVSAKPQPVGVEGAPMSRLFRRSTLALAAAAAAVLAAPLAAHAQYFGQNKVQYRTFDFRILRTPHFDVYYYPEEESAARDASRMAERWYARYSRILDHEFEARQPLILYGSSPEFQQTSVLQGDIGEGTGGVTEVFKQRIVLPFAGAYRETDHVIGHELVHAFQYDIPGLGRAGGGLEAAAARFNAPLWFIEGMAEYLSIGPVDPNTTMWLRDAALTNPLPNQAQLNYDPRFFPYRWGQALWAYVGGRWGDAAIGQILKQVGQGVPYEDAFERILNSDVDQIIRDWHDSIRRTYLPLLTEQREASETATPLVVSRTQNRGDYNVSPAVSPDGRQFAYLSSAGFIDIQLYLADATTGKVQRRLVKGTSIDPHFGSLRFINSAGAWSPDQRRFAFAALRKGHDVVALLDIPSARILREYEIPGGGEISNPTFSADGGTVVVSGIKGGISDLYAVDLASGRSRQLTNDKVAQ